MEKKIDFEKSLNILKDILDKVSDEKTTIDDSLKLYDDAKKIIIDLSKALDEAKEKVEKVIE